MSFAEAEEALAATPSATDTFDPDLVEGLPEPAARMLRHAIAPGTPLARGARLRLSGSVVQRGRRLALSAEERLVPGVGFTWAARGSLGPLWVVVRDHYVEGSSAVDVRLLGILPLGGERGEDTAASSRGRLAGESLWVPSGLLPQPGVAWHAVDASRARVDLTIAGATESVTFTADPDGAVSEIAMQRWGDVGVDRPQRIPYGFRVLAERTFGGFTIASHVKGGWWYGTDRYVPDQASTFTVTGATYT